MKLSTMTNLFYNHAANGDEAYLESVRKTHEIGFDVMDFCMCPVQRRETELNGDRWQFIVDRIGNEAAKLGVTFSQSHIPYSRNKPGLAKTDDVCEKNDYFIEMTKRCIEISGMLGVKWAVAHPVTDFDDPCDVAHSIAYNHEIYDKYVERAAALGVGIAFENMADSAVGNAMYRRFGCNAYELCELIDSFGSPYVGACWDFGHANRASLKPQSRELAKLGARLKATHVDDNIGQTDLHTIPFFGTVDWKDAVTALKDIGYAGDFNFELAVCKRMPEALKPAAVRFIYETGRYLIDTYGN